MIDGDELERSYKHHLSDYSEWEQRDHASNWMLMEDNLGDNLSIDETMLQEDLVTILSNKDGHCKQGSVMSIVRGTKAEDVIEVLNYFINHSTNAGAESLNSKIKSFRSQLRGVSDYNFFMYRLYKIFG